MSGDLAMDVLGGVGAVSAFFAGLNLYQWRRQSQRSENLSRAVPLNAISDTSASSQPQYVVAEGIAHTDRPLMTSDGKSGCISLTTVHTDFFKRLFFGYETADGMQTRTHTEARDFTVDVTKHNATANATDITAVSDITAATTALVHVPRSLLLKSVLSPTLVSDLHTSHIRDPVLTAAAVKANLLENKLLTSQLIVESGIPNDRQMTVIGWRVLHDGRPYIVPSAHSALSRNNDHSSALYVPSELDKTYADHPIIISDKPYVVIVADEAAAAAAHWRWSLISAAITAISIGAALGRSLYLQYVARCELERVMAFYQQRRANDQLRRQLRLAAVDAAQQQVNTAQPKSSRSQKKEKRHKRSKRHNGRQQHNDNDDEKSADSDSDCMSTHNAPMNLSAHPLLVGSDIDEESLCVICTESRANCVLLTCGHMFTCQSCAEKVQLCPVCRKTITQRIKVYQN